MNSVKRNFLLNSAYQILAVITPLITAPYISRVLGANGIGVYSYHYAIATYFLIFAMLGVQNYGNRSVAEQRHNKTELSRTFCSIYTFQCLCSFFVLASYSIYIIFICKDNIYVAMIQGLLVISALFDISWFFFGMELFKITTIRSAIIKVFTVISLFVFVKSADDIWLYTLIMAGGTLLSQIVMWPFLKKYIFFIKPTAKEIFIHFKPNCILFVPVIAINLYKYVGKLMLGSMSDIKQLGYFESADKIIQIPNSIITALGTVTLPRISSLVSEKKTREIKNINENSMFFVVFMESAFSFGIVAIAETFVPFFLGGDFILVTDLLKYLAPAMLFISWATIIRTQYLLPNLKDKTYLITVIAGALVNILINAILIPRIGARGAAISVLFSELSVCLLQTIIVWNKMEIRKYVKNGIPFILFGLIMYLSIKNISCGNNVLTFSTQTIVGAAIYLLLSFGYMNLFHKNTLRYLTAFNKNKN